MGRRAATTPGAPSASSGTPPPRRRPRTSIRPPWSLTAPTNTAARKSTTASRRRRTLASSPLVDRQGHGADGDLHGRRTYHPAHQFDTMEQQKESSTLGMWLFLVTEIMFFGGLFTAYVIYRNMYPEAFAAASSTLNVPLGALNTAVLICSSLTMALAIRSAQVNWRNGILIFLALTMLLGMTFLGIQAIQHPVTPVWQYVLVFILLLVGTGLTVGASLMDMGWVNTPVALTIAVGKALLVLLVFMELRHSTRMTVLTAAAGFFWLFLMIGLFLMDYGTRGAIVLPVPGK